MTSTRQSGTLQSPSPSSASSAASSTAASSHSSVSTPSTPFTDSRHPDYSALRVSDLAISDTVVARVRAFVFKRGSLRTIESPAQSSQPATNNINFSAANVSHSGRASSDDSNSPDVSPLTPVIRGAAIPVPVSSVPASPVSASSNGSIHSLIATPVLIKSFSAKLPTDEQVTRLKFEYMAFQRLPEKLGKPLTLLSHEQEGLCLLYEDTGGITIDHFVYGFGLSLPQIVCTEDDSNNHNRTHTGNQTLGLSPTITTTPATTVSTSPYGGNSLTAPLTPGSPAPSPVPLTVTHSTRQPIALSCVVRVARSLTQMLMSLHRVNVVYKALRPASLLFNEDNDRCMFLEFHASSLLSRERPIIEELNEFGDPSLLAYISPEQTGRMNRTLDSRTDLYSLGVCIFELLTGAPPFISTDPMEVIHFHLAKACPDPITVLQQKTGIAASTLPDRERESLGCLGAIVQKLMAKQVEDRYQSAAGLCSDLDYCLDLLTKREAPPQVPKSLSPLLTGRSLSDLAAAVAKHEAVEIVPPTASAAMASSLLPAVLASPLSPPPSNASTGSDRPFRVGRTDVLSQFRISQKLYGREEQVKILLEAFARISGQEGEGAFEEWNQEYSNANTASNPPSQHAPSATSSAQSNSSVFAASSSTSSTTSTRAKCVISPFVSTVCIPPQPEFVLIAGYSGVGKTSIVDEVQKPIVKHRGLWAKGKFDLYRRNHVVLLQAFQGLMTQLLTQNVDHWRSKLLAALGNDGQVMIDVIPELEKIIGPQPPVSQLGATDGEKRFFRTFLNLVHALAQAQHPLTLFIDDLQWSDTLSLQLIKSMLTQGAAHLLIIGAYRDNEVHATHPLTRLIEELTECDGADKHTPPDGSSAAVNTPNLHTIILKPIQLQHIIALVKDSLRCSESSAVDLAKLLYQRTQGNPFFINSLLQQFHNDRLIYFDYKCGAWQWNIETLRLANVSNDVVDLLCNQIQKLDRSLVEIMKLAACIGNTFTLSSLAIVAQCNEDEATYHLWQLSITGLIIPISNQYDLFVIAEQFRLQQSSIEVSLPVSISGPGFQPKNVRFRFSHDRIQQAAASLIPDQEKRSMHLKIARLLASHCEAEDLDYQVIEIVEHYNQGDATTSLTDNDEIRRVINYEMRAAEKAKHSTAYISAEEYLRVAKTLLDRLAANAGMSSPFELDYSLSVRIYVALCQGLALNANMAVAETVVREALAHVHTVFDRVDLLFVQQHVQKSAGDMVGATMTGIECLRLLDYRLADIEEIRALAQDSQRLFEEFDKVAQQSRMTDRRNWAIMDVLVNLTPCSVFVSTPPFIFSSVVHGMVRHSADNGLTDSSAFALSSYSHVLWGEGQPQLCYRAGREALRVLELTNAPMSVRAKVLTTYHGCIQFWMEPISSSWHALFLNAELCAENGNDEFQGYCLTYGQSLMFADGQPLERIAQKQRDMLALFRKRSNSFASIFCRMYRFVVAKLLGEIGRDKDSHQTLTSLATTTAANQAPLWLDMDEVLQDLHRSKLAMLVMVNLTCQCLVFYMERDFVRAAAAGEQGWQQFLHQGHGGAAGLISNVRLLFYFGLTLLAVAPLTVDLQSAVPLQLSNNDDDTFDAVIASSFAAVKKMYELNQTNGVDRTSPVTPNRSVSVRSEVHRNLTVQVSESMPHSAAAILTKVTAIQKHMALWATHNPGNFANKHALVDAERMRLFIFSHPHAHSFGLRTDLIIPCLRLYEKSISLSRVNGFIQEEALANELCGRFCFAVDLKREAEGYMKSAFWGYVRYGCQLKQQQLRIEFPHLFSQEFDHGAPKTHAAGTSTGVSNGGSSVLRNSHSTALLTAPTTESHRVGSEASDTVPTNHLVETLAHSPGTSAVSSADSPSSSNVSLTSPPDIAHTLSAASTFNSSVPTPSSSHLQPIAYPLPASVGAHSSHATQSNPTSSPMTWDHIDIAAVMKACMAFSVQTDLNKLVRSLLWLVIQTAGASRGTLLLKTGDTWAVELAVSVEDNREHAPAELTSPPSIVSSMPTTLFNLVCSTHNTVLISGNELKAGVYANDSYLSNHRVKACLAMPIMQQNKLTGILYLQNDHSADSFTRTHLQILLVLTQQAALSIENARLYSRLQQYTQELQNNNAELQREIVQRQVAQEDMRRAKEAAEKAAETKSAFLSNMSHEIRTPMNAVLGLTRLLQDTELTAEQSSYLQMITNSGKLLLTIISDVLDFSRIESNNLELEYRRFSLLECVENAVHLCFDMAAKKQLDLAYYVDRTVPAYIFGDSSRLQQILLNLLSNACKFTPAKGHVIVMVKCMFVDANAPGVKALATKALHQAASVAQHVHSPTHSEGSDSNASSSNPNTTTSKGNPMPRPRLSATPQPSSRRLQPHSGLGANDGSDTGSASGNDGGHSLSFTAPRDHRVARVTSQSANNSPSTTPPLGVITVGGNTPPNHQFVCLEFSVRDTGLGISEETQQRLFKSFSQGDTSVVRRFGGTGLGLAISKRLALAMNGEMWCESELGKGSTFYFTIQTAAVAVPLTRQSTTAEQTVVANALAMISAPSGLGDGVLKTFPSFSPLSLSSTGAMASSVMSPINSLSPYTSTPPGGSIHKLSSLELQRLSHKRILLVADQAAQRSTLVRLLSSYEMEVTPLSSLSDAVNYANDTMNGDGMMPHGIILDYQGCTHSPQHIAIIDQLVAALAARAELHAHTTNTSSTGHQPTSFTFASPIQRRGAFHPLVLLFTTRLVSGSADAGHHHADLEFVKPTAQPHNNNDNSDDEEEQQHEQQSEDVEGQSSESEADESSDSPSQPPTTAITPASRPAGLENEVAIVNSLVLAKLSNLEHQTQREPEPRDARKSTKLERKASSASSASSSMQRARALSSNRVKVIKIGQSSTNTTNITDDTLLINAQLSSTSTASLRSSSSPLSASGFSNSCEPADYLLLELTKPYKQHDLLTTLADHLPDENGLRGLDRWQSRFSSSGSHASVEGTSPAQPLTPEQMSANDSRMKREISDPVTSAASLVFQTSAPSTIVTSAVDHAQFYNQSPVASLKSDTSALDPSAASPAVSHCSLTVPSRSLEESPALSPSHSPYLAVSPVYASTGASPTISATSRPALRVVKNHNATPRQSIAAISADYPLTILLAEDNPVNSKMMRLFLKKLGYECDVVTSGEDVLEFVYARYTSDPSKPVIDCVLMDVNMDGMDGIECTKRLRALDYGQRPYIIACTANANTESREKCLDAGMQNFLAKPVILEELSKQLKAAHVELQRRDQTAAAADD